MRLCSLCTLSESAQKKNSHVTLASGQEGSPAHWDVEAVFADAREEYRPRLALEREPPHEHDLKEHLSSDLPGDVAFYRCLSASVCWCIILMPPFRAAIAQGSRIEFLQLLLLASRPISRTDSLACVENKR